jgi:CxxC motif-containing protein (DUF1111 family)
MRAAKLALPATAVWLMCLADPAEAQVSRARDPGVRGGAPGAGEPLPGLTPSQLAIFEVGKEDFSEAEGVADGLGPRFNLDGCLGCHAQPAVGGTSPRANPQAVVATDFGARNVLPYFITPDGPVREARFKYKPDGSRDGGVHALFVVSGRADESGDASGCDLAQPDFAAEGRRGNVIFRIPTPVFGAGLIEQVPDAAILANARAGSTRKAALGISGRPHRSRPGSGGGPSGSGNANGNDGTLSRFGWKAQNKSLLLFSGEAYNVEMGITNELFQTERDETAECQLATVPNDFTDTDAESVEEMLSGVEKFALFMRFLAAPEPSPDTPGGAASIANGRALFASTGCAECHTPALPTGDSSVEALRNQTAALYSDLLLHNMGPGLADDVVQGEAGPDEFRTAPLWGLGQRIFFLHDGRTSDLVEAIRAHRSAGNTRFRASEANYVVDAFDRLGERQKQDVLNFLRSL